MIGASEGVDREKIVLIVDDEIHIQQSLALFLTEEGFQVKKASNGQEALDFLRSQTFKTCLVLLDLMMPVKGGFEFRVEQLQDPTISEVPIAIMSAGRLSPELLREMVPQEILAKPFSLDQLLVTVGRYYR